MNTSAAYSASPSSCGNYLCLVDAVVMLGERLVDGWRLSDIRSADGNERFELACSRLKTMLIGGELQAFGLDDEDAYHLLPPERLSKPYFDINVERSCFRWAPPNDWTIIFVSRSGLQTRLDAIQPSKARKVAKYCWRDISCIAWELALERPGLRKQTLLVDAIQQHFENTHDQHPDAKELQPLAKRIIAHIGDRVLSKEVFPKETSSDTLKNPD